MEYEAVGSGEGIRRFIGQGIKDEDKVDFGASDAAMQDEQMARVRVAQFFCLSPLAPLRSPTIFRALPGK